MSDQDTTARGGGGSSTNRRESARRTGRQQDNPRRPAPALNMEELRELLQLIATHGFTDFEYEREGFRVRLQRKVRSPKSAMADAISASPKPHPAMPLTAVDLQTDIAQEASVAVSSSTPAEMSVATEKNNNLYTITSPIVGTFYRTPSPTAEPFVRVGSHVELVTVVCIIEAMKLMNEIQAETTGVIEKIYVENAQPVEYGQPLFDVRK